MPLVLDADGLVALPVTAVDSASGTAQREATVLTPHEASSSG